MSYKQIKQKRIGSALMGYSFTSFRTIYNELEDWQMKS